MRAVQEKCDAGVSEIGARLAPAVQLARRLGEVPEAERGAAMLGAIAAGMLGRWRVDDYREVIFQGLLGGGMEHSRATVLVTRYVDDAPPLENCALAFQVALAAIVGAEDEPPGETQAPPATRRRRSRGASSASPTSTAAAP